MTAEQLETLRREASRALLAEASANESAASTRREMTSAALAVANALADGETPAQSAVTSFAILREAWTEREDAAALASARRLRAFEAWHRAKSESTARARLAAFTNERALQAAETEAEAAR